MTYPDPPEVPSEVVNAIANAMGLELNVAREAAGWPPLINGDPLIEINKLSIRLLAMEKKVEAITSRLNFSEEQIDAMIETGIFKPEDFKKLLEELA